MHEKSILLLVIILSGFSNLVFPEPDQGSGPVIIEGGFGLDDKAMLLLENAFAKNQRGTRFYFERHDLTRLIETLSVINFELGLIFQNFQSMDTQGYKRKFINHGKIPFQLFTENTRPKEYKEILSRYVEIDIGQGAVKMSDSECIAVLGDGFIQLKDGSNEVYYTRTGCFRINEKHELIHESGMAVRVNLKVAKGIRYARFTLDGSGKVYLVDYDDKKEKSQIGQLTLYSFGEPSLLQEVKPGIFRYSGKVSSVVSGRPKSKGFGETHGGFLEMANVDSYDEYINLFILERLRSMIIDSITKLDHEFARDFSNVHSNEYLMVARLLKDNKDVKSIIQRASERKKFYLPKKSRMLRTKHSKRRVKIKRP